MLGKPNNISFTTTTIYPVQPPSDILFNQNHISGTTTTIYIVQQPPYILCSATTTRYYLKTLPHFCATRNTYPVQSRLNILCNHHHISYSTTTRYPCIPYNISPATSNTYPPQPLGKYQERKLETECWYARLFKAN